MNTPLFSPRIWRIHGTDYYGDEPVEAPRRHTDTALAQVAEMGYDGVWIHTELRELAPTDLFAGYVHDVDRRIENLAIAARRARKHGLGIWLYLCEPRGLPRSSPFWQEHPDCQGEPERDTAIAWRRGPEWLEVYCMCLGAEKVRTFLNESTRQLFSTIPELAGAFVITASEHPTHCFSHLGRRKDRTIGCPRCRDRDPLDMPVDVARAMQAGLTASGAPARLAFWTWSWSTLGPDPQPSIVENLPKEVALLSDFERGETITLRGKPIVVDEYSLGLVGPSTRFRQYADACKTVGREIWAKFQVNATHELATVPNIPVPGTLYDKCAAAREVGVSGVMGTWTMAVRPTLNSFAAGRLMAGAGPLPERRAFLASFARGYFGAGFTAKDIETILASWGQFAEAMKRYPTTMNFVYFSPVNYAPAYPWTLKRLQTRMARSWTAEPWGDLLEMATGDLALGEMGQVMSDVAERWAAGMSGYERVLQPLVSDSETAKQELNAAKACGLFFRSCADAFLFADAVEGKAPPTQIVEILDRETATCRAAVPLLEFDPRLGWHDDLQRRMLTEDQVREKLANLVAMRKQLMPN